MFSSLFLRVKTLWAISLYRNSFWLMAGSFSMAGIGFVYWILAARLYSTIEIGLATTFLSATSLVNGFAMLGFGTTLIRYLPSSNKKEKKINTAFTMVCIAALVIGSIYILGLSVWTEKLVFLKSSFPLMLLLIAFFPVNALNGITDSVFTAFKETQWVFLSNIVQSLSKLLFLVVLPTLGVWGIIGSNILGIFAAVVTCFILISRLYKIDFKPLIDNEVIEETKRYALGNYISSLIGALPSLLIPIIITNKISPEQTAYFFMPNMLVSLLTIIPAMISRSYFTEGSNANKAGSFWKPVQFTYLLLIPLALFLFIFGKEVLLLFGKNYSVEGYTYLVLGTISVLISVVNFFLGTRLLIEHQLRAILKINLTSTFFYLTLAWLLTSKGINGIALAAILNQTILLLITTLVVNNLANKSMENN